MDAIKEGVVNWIVSMLSGFDANVNSVAAILSENIFSEGNPMYGVAQSISAAVMPIALTIIGICFLIEFLNISIKMDILKWELGLKVFFKLAIAQAALTMMPQFLSLIYSSGAELLARALGGSSEIGTKALEILGPLTAGLSWGGALSLVVTMAVPLLAVWVCGIIIKVMAFARMFELVVHVAIAPLPCAFLPLESSHITKRFFFSFAGVCLQGVFMIICISLFGTITVSLLDNLMKPGASLPDIMFNMLIGSLVLVMSIAKTGQWANKILDAG